MTELFINKNVLVLYPTDDGDFFIWFEPLKKHFKSIHLLNYTMHCHMNGIKNTEQHITDLVTDKKIDIVLIIPFASDYQISVEFYHSLRKKVKIVFWFADDATYFEVYNRYYAQVADAVITADCFAVAAYKRLGMPVILYQFIDVRNKIRPVDIEKDIDVCFIGDMKKPGRNEYIKFLRDNGINVVVYGYGSQNGFLPYEKMSEYLCRSKINLNFTQVAYPDWINFDEPLLNLVRQNNGRPRETALARAFCLSEYSPGLDTMFDIGKEIDVFHDKTELLEKVKYYLSNPSKREEMAAAAYERAVQNYLPEIYIPKMLKDMMNVLENRDRLNVRVDKIYLSNGFKVKTINGLTFSMFVMLKNGKLKFAFETFLLLFKYGFMVFLLGFYGGLTRVLQSVLRKIKAVKSV